MKLSDAKLIGQSYVDEKTGVTFWMHPSTPMGYFVSRDYFVGQGLSPNDFVIDMFLTTDAFLLAIESERDDLNIQRYLDMRIGKTVKERHELFLVLIDFDYADIVINAYKNTRKNEFPLEIPPEIANDDKLKKSTSQTSSNGRSKPKTTQETSVPKDTKSTIQVAT